MLQQRHGLYSFGLQPTSPSGIGTRSGIVLPADELSCGPCDFTFAGRPTLAGFLNTDLTQASPRQMDPRAQATLGRGLQPNVAAVTARHVAGDGQAEADAAGQRVA